MMKNYRHPNIKINIQKMSHVRLLFLKYLFAFLSLCLIIRLIFLQFYQYKHYATLSLKNQMSIIPIPPSRGIIYDRNGQLLAENRPVFVLELTPERIKDLATTLQRLQQLIPSITTEDIQHFNKEIQQQRKDLPCILKINLSDEEIAKFSSQQYRFPGVNLKAKPMRYYPYHKLMSHLIGYVGRINTDELKQIDPTAYQGTNYIGKIGIEKYYEHLLHGSLGYEQVETNVSGKIVRTIFRQPPSSGDKIYLTIDTRLQKVAYHALKNLEGSAVLIDLQDGGILAMVSRPSFDPNLFTNGIPAKKFNQLLLANNKPLFHRAIRGLYPPASTVKPFIALAGLNKGIIDPQQIIYDPGWYQIAGIKHRYRDWKRSGHGVTNVKRAIMVSCDTYFYTLGSKLGIHSLADTLKKFGFGQKTGIDLPEELSGLVPEPQWKLQQKKLPWYPGDTIITAIGQGYMLASPLQLAYAASILAQKGQAFQPHLLQRSIDDHGQIHHYHPMQKTYIRLDNPEHWKLIHEAMQAVIENNEGTGGRFGRNASYTVAGKTGTAQVFALSQHDHNQKMTIANKILKDHSWFIAFAPAEHPEVAVATMVEHDTTASQVARQLLDAYFQLQHTKDHHAH